MLREKIHLKLNGRKDELEMPFEIIAKKANLGLATVKRAFNRYDMTLGTLEKILEVLALDENFNQTISAKKLYQQALERKANEIVLRVYQTSRLEAQEPTKAAKDKMMKQAIATISKLPKSKIWL
jgi:hypothetical protein